jgi:hypothetical protein
MDPTSYFARLVASAQRIAGHANVPGKGEAVDQCLEDIEDLSLAGRITAEQRGVLRAILTRACSHAA